MKNNIRLHFGKFVPVPAKSLGLPEDSGNGYYSYSYYILPYTGNLSIDARAAVVKHLFNKFFSPPFTSLGTVEQHSVVTENRNGLEVETGGELRVQLIYHHGD